MALLKRAVNEQAYLKAGFLGFPGTGKTYTAAMLAIALAKLDPKRRPVAFVDTETGSDFVLPRFELEGVELMRIKSKSFSDLLAVAKEAEAGCSVLIVDSITHVWRELCDSYARKRGIKKMQFQHWADVKAEWGQWTIAYLNYQLHIIVCGRAGFEWDFQNDDEGKKELIKVGTKMKVETEFGFEPSLLIEMERAERSTKPGAGWIHRAHVLKDRTDTINGKAFDFQRIRGGYKVGGWKAVFDAFAPAIDCLNLGGAHLGVDSSRSSEDRFSGEPADFTWKKEQEAKDIALDEIQEEIKRAYPTKSNEDTKARADLLEKLTGSRSWKNVEAMKWPQIKAFRDDVWMELRGYPYGTPKDSPKTLTEKEVVRFAEGEFEEKPAPKDDGLDAIREDLGYGKPQQPSPIEALAQELAPSGEGGAGGFEEGGMAPDVGEPEDAVSDFDRIKERARKEREALDEAAAARKAK